MGHGRVLGRSALVASSVGDGVSPGLATDEVTSCPARTVASSRGAVSAGAGGRRPASEGSSTPGRVARRPPLNGVTTTGSSALSSGGTSRATVGPKSATVETRPVTGGSHGGRGGTSVTRPTSCVTVSVSTGSTTTGPTTAWSSTPGFTVCCGATTLLRRKTGRTRAGRVPTSSGPAARRAVSRPARRP